MSKQRTLGCKLSHYKLCQLGPELTPGEGCPRWNQSHPIQSWLLNSSLLSRRWLLVNSDPHEAMRTVCLCDRINRMPYLTPIPETKVLLRIKTYYWHSPELGVFLHNPQDFSCASQLITEHHFLPDNFSRNWRGTGLVSHFCTQAVTEYAPLTSRPYTQLCWVQVKNPLLRAVFLPPDRTATCPPEPHTLCRLLSQHPCT